MDRTLLLLEEEEDKEGTEGMAAEGTTSEMRGLSNNLLKAGRVDSRILGRTVVGDGEVAEEVNEVAETFRVSAEVVGEVVVVDNFFNDFVV